jgi:hypothetical protein
VPRIINFLESNDALAKMASKFIPYLYKFVVFFLDGEVPSNLATCKYFLFYWPGPRRHVGINALSRQPQLYLNSIVVEGAGLPDGIFFKPKIPIRVNFGKSCNRRC